NVQHPYPKQDRTNRKPGPVIKLPLFFLFFMFFSYGYCPQEGDAVSLTTDRDQAIEARSFPSNLEEKYQGKDFNYERTEGEAQNLLERSLNWAFQGLRDTFGFDVPPYLLKIIEY